MIYCVEDERNIRELLVYTLHSTGFEAKGLENGEQLFEELGNLIPDLILLDIMLPGDDRPLIPVAILVLGIILVAGYFLLH